MASSRPLAGKCCWIITDDKIGMQVQCFGVAAALGLKTEHKQVAPRGLTRLLAPWSSPARGERFGHDGGPFAPPWPEIAIATGRLSIPYLRALMRRAGPGTYSVVLQDPRTGPKTADLIWVPEHDRRRGANVITTLAAPHSFTASRIEELRRTIPPAIAALPHPRVAVMLGGPSGVYRFTPADGKRLGAALASLAGLSCSFLITPSRRTPAPIIAAVDVATQNAPRILWRGEEPNPYSEFLAHADRLVVTADSVNMCGEAAATGRPVHVFHPDGHSEKFARFHDGLVRHGATRPLADRLTRLEEWTYEPLDSASVIAAEIERRWLRRTAAPKGP